MPIFITYEILRRERSFIIDFIEALKTYNQNCILIHQQTLINILPFIKPSIIIFKSADFGRINWYKKANRFGHACFCFESEGLLVHPTDFANVKVCIENLLILKKYFVCGNYQKSLLEKKFNKYSEKFLVVGSPSIDFLSKKSNQYINYSSQNSNIGILTGFGSFNPRGLKNYIEIVKSMNKLKLPKERLDELEEFYQVSKRGFLEFQEITKFISKNFLSSKIYIRVHPSESPNPWIKLSKRFPNCKIDSSSSIYEFLGKCHKIISFKSTVAIEALAIKRPITSYCPPFIDPQNNFYPNNEPEKLSITINSKEKLLNYLNQKNEFTYKKFIKNSDVIENAEKICFGFSDPKYSSSKKICSSIIEFQESNSSFKISKISRKYKIYISTLVIFSHFLTILKNPIGYIAYGKSKFGSRFEITKLNKELKSSSILNNFLSFITRIITINF